MNRALHIPTLDGLRGIAALLVVLSHVKKMGISSHAPPFAGPLGVMLFFILSGFLMGHLYLRKPADWPSFVHFLSARFGRVLPLYLLVVTLSYLISLIVGKGFIYYLDEWTFVKQLLFVGSAHVFWSIPPEMEFYVLFLGIWWMHQTRLLYNYLPLTVGVTALILLARPFLPGITVFGQLQLFLSGLFCVGGYHLMSRNDVNTKAVIFAQSVALIACALLLTNIVQIPKSVFEGARSPDDGVYGSLPIALAVSGAFLAFTVETWLSRAILCNRFAKIIGSWSFSIYLLHEPVIAGTTQLLVYTQLNSFFVFLLGIAILLGVAAFSHEMFEMPMQKIVRGMTQRLLNKMGHSFTTAER